MFFSFWKKSFCFFFVACDYFLAIEISDIDYHMTRAWYNGEKDNRELLTWVRVIVIWHNINTHKAINLHPVVWNELSLSLFLSLPFSLSLSLSLSLTSVWSGPFSPLSPCIILLPPLTSLTWYHIPVPSHLSHLVSPGTWLPIPGPLSPLSPGIIFDIAGPLSPLSPGIILLVCRGQGGECWQGSLDSRAVVASVPGSVILRTDKRHTMSDTKSTSSDILRESYQIELMRYKHIMHSIKQLVQWSTHQFFVSQLRSPVLQKRSTNYHRLDMWRSLSVPRPGWLGLMARAAISSALQSAGCRDQLSAGSFNDRLERSKQFEMPGSTKVRSRNSVPSRRFDWSQIVPKQSIQENFNAGLWTSRSQNKTLFGDCPEPNKGPSGKTSRQWCYKKNGTD